MSRLFEERERAEELFFARNQELAFIAHCRAVRRLGSFAGEKMGFDGATARDYAESLVDSLAHGVKDDAIVARVHADLVENGVTMDRQTLQAELVRLQALVTSEIAARAARASDAASANAR